MGETWLRLSFIFSALWTRWHEFCSLYWGNSEPLALATQRTASDQGGRCLRGWQIAIDVRQQKRGGGWFLVDSIGHSPAYGCTGLCSTRKQSQTGAAWAAEPEPGSGRLRQGTSPKQQRTGPLSLRLPVLCSGHPLLPLHLLAARKSYLTCSAGAGEAKRRPKSPKSGGLGDSWALQTCNGTVWNAEPPAASLARTLSPAGFVCIWKLCLWSQTI